MPHTKRLLFCDVNGTILDDWQPAFEGLAAVLAHFGVERPHLEDYVREVGNDGDYRGFYVRRGIVADRDELYDLFLPVYRAYAHEMQIMPGIHDAFDRMKCAGVEIHILTAARKDFVEPMLIDAGVYELCDSYHYHVHDKGEQVRAVMSGMGIRPERITMVGDLPSDVVHAKQAGICGVGFRNEHVPSDLFRDLVEMDFFAFSFEGLSDFVLSR